MKSIKYGLIVLLAFIGFGVSNNQKATEAEAIQTSTLRFFIDRTNWENSGAVVKFEYGTGLNATNTIESITGTLIAPNGYIENSSMKKTWNQTPNALDNRWYAWYEVPTTIIGKEWIIRRFNPDSTTLWNSSSKYTFTEGINNQMWYIWDNWSGTISQGSVDATNGAFLKYVLEGYMTCSSDTSNGYGAYPTLNSTYFMNGETPRYSDSLDDDMVNDFSLQSNYSTGTKDATVSVATKINAMASLYQAANPTAVPSTPVHADKNPLAILALVIAAISLTSGYFIIFKKRLIA